MAEIPGAQFLGPAGAAYSGFKTYQRLASGDIIGALSGGLFGKSGIFGGGGLFGGAKMKPGTAALSRTTKIFNRIAANSTTRFGPIMGIATAGPASGKQAERVKFAAGVFLRYGFPSDETIDAILAKTRTFAGSFDPVQSNIDATKEDIANRVFPGGSGKAKYLFEQTKRTDLQAAGLLANEGVNLKTKAMRQGAINITATGQIHDFVEKELFDLATSVQSGKPMPMQGEQPLPMEEPKEPGLQLPDFAGRGVGDGIRQPGEGEPGGDGRGGRGGRPLRLPRFPVQGKELRFPRIDLQVGDLPYGQAPPFSSEVGRFPVETDIVPSGRPSLAQQKVRRGKKLQLFSETPHILS